MYKGTKRTAVILGCSNTVWQDYDLVKAKYKPSDLIHFAVNDIAIQFHEAPVEHVVSLHSSFASHLKSLYTIRNTCAITSHGFENYDNIDMSWWGKLTNQGGTSSLFAVEIALELGITDIVVCGVTLDKRPHYYEDQRNTESEVFDFGRCMESTIWINKFETERKDQKQYIKFTSGSLKNYFGGIDGK